MNKEEIKINEAEKLPTKEKKKSKTILSIILYVILGIFLIFDGFAIYSKLSMKDGNGAANFFGNQVRVVLTNSMNGTDEFYEEHPEFAIKRINPHDAVFIKTAPGGDADQKKIDKYYSKIVVGDVMTFVDKGLDKVLTHRVIRIQVRIDPHTGGKIYDFTFSGDHPDAQKDIPQYAESNSGWIYGKVTGVNVAIGNLLYAFMENKLVLTFIVVVPCGVFALIEIMKIVFYISHYRKEQALEASKLAINEKDEDIERLKKELEELKKKGNNSKEE